MRVWTAKRESEGTGISFPVGHRNNYPSYLEAMQACEDDYQAELSFYEQDDGSFVHRGWLNFYVTPVDFIKNMGDEDWKNGN